MNFEFDDEQTLFRDTVDRLFASHAAASPRDVATEWQAYRDLGLLAFPFPPALGGLGGGQEAMMFVMEAYGRTLARAPYLQSVLLAGNVLARAAGVAAHRALKGMLEGRLTLALCLFEPGTRYLWETPTTQAVRTDSGWRLNGGKAAVLDAGSADLLVCSAATPEGMGLFLLPADAAGVVLRVRTTPDGRSAADVQLVDVELPADMAIGTSSETVAWLAAAIDDAMVACCAEMVGAMEQLLAITTDHLKTRSQFGVALGSFQALQHRAADMLVAMEQARSMTFHAVSMLDAAPHARGMAVAATKALVNRAARFVGSEAIQLHGGAGLASECLAGRYFQRLTVLEMMFGDTDYLLSRVERGGGLGG